MYSPIKDHLYHTAKVSLGQTSTHNSPLSGVVSNVLLTSYDVQRGSIGAAASVLIGKYGGRTIWQRGLPSNPSPTNERAELTAIVLGFEQALAKYSEMTRNPVLNVRIFTDSPYAWKCMTMWKEKWLRNDFTASDGHLVGNRDLLRQAYDLQEDLEREGELEIILIHKKRNRMAGAEVKELLNEMEGKATIFT